MSVHIFDIVCCTLIGVDQCVCVGLLQILASTYDDELKKRKEHSRKSESSEDVAVNGGFVWNNRCSETWECFV